MLHLGLGISGISAADSSPGNAGASGHVPPALGDPTVNLSTNKTDVEAGGVASCLATLTEARLVDTVINALTDNGAAEIVTPITIPAGELQVQFFVANLGGFTGVVTYTATTDIAVNNTLQFNFSDFA